MTSFCWRRLPFRVIIGAKNSRFYHVGSAVVSRTDLSKTACINSQIRSFAADALGSNHSNLILTVSTGPLAGTTLLVPEGEVRTVGRTNASFFVTDDSFMSGVHFEIQNFGDFAELRDLQSRNKTKLNDVTVAKDKIRTGDVIKAGKTYFTVQLETPPVELPVPEVVSDFRERQDEKPQASNSEHSSPISMSSVVFPVPAEPVTSERDEPRNDEEVVKGEPARYSSPFESVDHSFLPKELEKAADQSKVSSAEDFERSSFSSPFDSVRMPVKTTLPESNASQSSSGESDDYATTSSPTIRRLRQNSSVANDYDFWEIMVRLAKSEQVSIVAHFKKIGHNVPDGLKGLPVFPQIPQSKEYLPVIVDMAEWLRPNMKSITNRLQYADAVMLAILDNGGKGSGALQSLSQFGAAGFSEANGFLPWFWPSQLYTMCQLLPDSEICLMFGESIKGFVFAVPQLEQTLYACVDASLEPVLANFGFE